ncbi:winged helix-turn-helix domain-containing protein [Alkalimonas collagenimarina]|uniref:Winged helix-turn-helix domain-containing protein n=1 Tax=Alkalimonas collagenimarina TaxID=400390 RepID=A0ABT9GYW8_9GAMM|nr:winged helix-turn-helix domain-containing protein [Alkalimonas collagenimarina]MDP4536232.1 winged helix-turn-helix domain-containing protein [Alkalimonas collagenimarina]
MAIKPEHRVKVGEWWYLPERDKLVKLAPSGQVEATAELDNLCQNVINYLIVRAGDLVTKDELLDKVWGIRAVSDGRITRVIRVLRVALGDDSRTPLYIETVPKRGYRLVATIATEEQAAEAAAVEAAQTTLSSDASWQPRVRAAIITGLLLLPMLLAAIIWWFSASDSQEPAVTPLWRYEPVTFLDGIEFYHSISPDEKFLAFSYASSPSDDVVVLKLQNLETHQVITLTEEPYSSFGAAWSPDGTQLAYHRMLSGQLCEIRLLTLDSNKIGINSDRLLTECGSKSVSARLTWSPDGRYIVYPSREVGQRQMSLMLYPLAGGQAETLTAPPSNGFGDYAARFSRDGNRLAFLRDAAGAVQIWQLELSSRSSSMLLQLSDTSPGNIDWSLDDQAIIYPAGRSMLAAVQVETGQRRLLAYTDHNASEIQVSTSGRIIASVGAFSQLNILKVPNKILNTSGQLNQQVFSSNRSEAYAEASPVINGPVAVVSRRSGLSQVWLFYPDGRQHQLTNFTENERINQLTFSPDGTHLLALISQQLWLLHKDKDPIQITSFLEQNVSNPSWGADGRTIYYAVSRQGRWQVMTTHLDAPAQSELFNPQMELYLESRDGRYSFWQHSHTRHYYLQRMDGSPAERLELPLQESLPLHFVLAEDGLYYSSYLTDNRYQLYFLDFSNRKVTVATDLESIYSSHFSLSADKNYFYLPSMGRGDMDIAEIPIQQQNL